MLHKTSTLKGYTLQSLDGGIGKIQDFYFDDRHWTIRYLIADTGNWLPGRQVLISPLSLGPVTSHPKSISVDLTRQQIEDSPSLDCAKPVSRQFEATYFDYYQYPTYWDGPYMWGAYAHMVRSPAEGERLAPDPDAKAWDAHLRSTQAVSGYYIGAADGKIGHVADFIVDDETWAIRYLLVDTRNWWPGKKVLVAAQWIERVSWEESKVFINLTREAIKQAPEYSEESLLTRDYEAQLHGHYNRPGYWDEKTAGSDPCCDTPCDCCK